MAAINAMPPISVTYQKNVDSTPIDLNHNAFAPAKTGDDMNRGLFHTHLPMSYAYQQHYA